MRTRLSRISGFTLIEVLLAMMLGSLVTGICAALAVQCAVSRQAFESETLSQLAVARVLDQFELDMRSTLLHQPDGVPEIEFPSELGNLITIRGLATSLDVETGFAARLPAIISYCVEASKLKSDQIKLIRETKFLTDQNAAVQSTVLFEPIVAAAVETFRDGKWGTEKSMTGAQTKSLTAIRLRLQFPNHNAEVIKTVPIEPPKQPSPTGPLPH